MPELMKEQLEYMADHKVIIIETNLPGKNWYNTNTPCVTDKVVRDLMHLFREGKHIVRKTGHK